MKRGRVKIFFGDARYRRRAAARGSNATRRRSSIVSMAASTDMGEGPETGGMALVDPLTSVRTDGFLALQTIGN